jgi:microcompartment protein CcmL/EutN
MCHIGGFVSSDHIIPTPHLSLSAHSPPSPLPQQLQQKQQLPSYSNPIVGVIAAVATTELQQQHASLTFFGQKKHRKEPQKNKALTWLVVVPLVLRMCGPKKRNWMKKN